MLARVSPVEARPVNSSMVFGGCPAASMRTGDSINSAMAFPAYATVSRRVGPERIALRPNCESSKARVDAPGDRYALDAGVDIGLRTGRPQAERALEGHVLATTELMGMFER
jgi:hypothetical protein